MNVCVCVRKPSFVYMYWMLVSSSLQLEKEWQFGAFCVLYSMYSAMYEKKKTFNLKRDENDCGWPPDAPTVANLYQASPDTRILCYKNKKP